MNLFKQRGPQTVDGSGPDPTTATYAIIGESAGEEEVRDNAPFVGKAGWRLTRYIHSFGLRREWFWIDNLYPIRPPGNEIKAVKRDVIEWWIAHLYQRTAAMKGLQFIVAVGAYALYALTGKGKVNWEKHNDGIQKLSGYVFSHRTLDGRSIPVVGVIHSAAALRRWQFHRQCMQDWEKIAHIIKEGIGKHVEELHIVQPTMEVINHEIQRYEKSQKVVGIDIENPAEKLRVGTAKDGKPKWKKGKSVVTCFGSGDSSTRSLTIPTTLEYWKSEGLLSQAWEAIKYICELANEKLGQNFGYDAWVLYKQHGIWMRNWKWDTMLLEHTLDSTSGLSLGRLASRYSWCEYWKDEAKEPGESATFVSNIITFWEYNGKDVTRMYWVFEIVLELVKKAGLLDFFLKHYADVMYPQLFMGITGIRVDRFLAKQREVDLFLDCIGIQDKLEQITNTRLHTKVSLSDDLIKKYMYETKSYPLQKKKRGKSYKKTVSAGEVEVRRVMLEVPEFQEVGNLILDHRRKKKLAEFYSDTRVDEDSRIRCQYQSTTLAGRWKSKKTPIGTGTNNQNPDREIRDMYIADPGDVLIEVDQSQSESRFGDLIIHWITGKSFYRERALSLPSERDVHVERAAGIYKVSEKDVTDEQRYMGKRTSHAWFRDMGGKTFVEQLSKEGLTLLESEGQTLLNAMTALEPEIQDYFKYIRLKIHQDRVLWNSWGRALWFRYHVLDENPWEAENAYREGFSYNPQSECADLQQQHGVKPLWDLWTKHNDMNYWRMVLHAHDAILISVDPRIAYDLTNYFVANMQRPRSLYGVDFSMPCEIKVGLNWGKKQMHEFKAMPGQREFEEMVYGYVGR